MKFFAWFVINVLELTGKALWGFKPNLMREIVRHEGPAKAIAWFVQNMPRYEKTLKEWGPLRTHLLASEISVLNGCPYCVYGHIYALQLHYLKAKGQLLSVDEDEILAWISTGETEIIERFRQLITSSGLLSELPVLERMFVLRKGAGWPESADDHKILHLLEMFGVLNTCGIKGQTSPDQAHDPINKDVTLRRKYKLLRQESRTFNNSRSN